MMPMIAEDSVLDGPVGGSIRLAELDDVDDEDSPILCSGVVFGKTVRSNFACLSVVLLEQDDDDMMILVRIQFDPDANNNNRTLRSYCRRYYKLGDWIVVRRGTWRERDATSWPRFVVDVKDETISTAVQTLQSQYWPSHKVQALQRQHLQRCQPQGDPTTKEQPHTECQCHRDTSSQRHGASLSKRLQGTFVANFLVHMMLKHFDPTFSIPPEQWATTDPLKQSSSGLHQARALLNAGTGVIDAAGGSGHVSMALGLLGIRSTVIDPRENVGKLPKRVRKVWHRTLRNGDAHCLPVGATDFATLRAWIGTPPNGIDAVFRTPDNPSAKTLPVCDADHAIIQFCSAIVAFHPDEATDAIVDLAVQRKIPLVIVPCCVFHRLFPHRRKPNNEPVNTRLDLLEYLVAKHPSICKTDMPFQGSNTVLWSTFA